jgi:hypothetical protein
LVGTQEALKEMKRPSLVRCSCSKAIGTSDLSALGLYLQETKAPEPRFLQKLADMLDPRASGEPFLQLKNRPGRPPRRSFRPFAIISDPVARAIDNSDLTFIAGRLRDPYVDPRIIEWLAARLNPSTLNDPRFIVKKTRRPKGRPSSHHEKLERGRSVDEKFRQLGGYDGKPVLDKTLLSFSKKTACPGFSRSAARRYWKYYLEHK